MLRQIACFTALGLISLTTDLRAADSLLESPLDRLERSAIPSEELQLALNQA
jgi:hypothetical protein